MKTLVLASDNFDQTNTFKLAGVRGICSLRRDYEKRGDGIYWVMLHAGCLKSQYSAADTDERNRLANEAPIVNGETVTVDSKPYTVRILGNYSNAAVLEAQS